MKYGIIALVIGVLVLAGMFALWQVDKTTDQTMENAPQNTVVSDSSKNSPTVNQVGKPQTSQGDKSMVSDSPEMDALLNSFPKDGAIEQEITAFNAKVMKAAVYSKTLDISGCKPSPKYVHFRVGSSLLIKNSDSIEHQISYGGKNVIKIPAKSEQNITLDLSGGGTRGYRCDDKLVGVFYITQ